MNTTNWIFLLTLALASSIYPTARGAATAQRLAPPQIASVNPAQIATSTRIETIIINGSGFDPGARIEIMYDVGAGAGQWRTPRHGFQVLGVSQIRLNVMAGTDPDVLRVRVVSVAGTSNLAQVRVVNSAPAPTAAIRTAPVPATSSTNNATAATAPTRSASPQPTPMQPPQFALPAVLPSTPALNTAGSTPQTLPSTPLPRPVTYCGNSRTVQAALQIGEAIQATTGGDSFDTACQRHDACYDDCRTKQENCDRNLRTDAAAVCATSRIKSICNGEANIYFSVVDRFGESAFKKARANCPISPANAAIVAQISKPATQPAPFIVTQPATVTPLALRIEKVIPPQLTISPQPQSITINGSGFDSSTRVEWMYGKGIGAGEWRTPRLGHQVLSSTQIKVNIQSGNDSDHMQIRVVNARGYSNLGNFAIVMSSSAVAGNSSSVTVNPSNPSVNNSRYPISGQITQGFGVEWSENSQKTHTGVDISASKGTSVRSMSAGTARVGNLGGDWGDYVVIVEANGAAKAYLHLVPTVKSGQKGIRTGDEIGTVYKDHLHYNVCKQDAYCQRGALPTRTKDPKYPNDPLFRDGPFVSP